jgi:hypothetical protein
MLIPFGVLSAAGAGGATPFPIPDYELIASEILGSNQTSVTFSSLGDYSATYKHLQVRIVGKTDRTTADTDAIFLRLNGDTGSNYSQHQIQGAFGSVTSSGSGSAASIGISRFAGNENASLFGAAVIDLLDVYSTTKNKTIRSLGGAVSGGAFIVLVSGARYNTESLTSLSFGPAFGTNILTGSRFSLYGIKG